MFTGLIEEVGVVKNIKNSTVSAQLQIQCKKIMEDIELGASISVSGICLTVTSFTFDSFTVDVMPETMKVTTLKLLKINDKVNLERALSLQTRLGGHLVSGHVDGVGVIESIKQHDNAVLIKIKATTETLKYTILRGSITIDGISLTVCELGESHFSVSIIPHTFEHTTLSLKKEGDLVNLENDMIAKYTERLLTFQDNSKPQSKITIEYLKENGF
ncbi:MAG: riboflavin synthase [Brevinema sp.]